MRTKGSNFIPIEDVYLVKAWLEISCDSIISNGQKKERMWDRILERYNLRKGGHQRKSLRSLQSRWRGIEELMGKFASHYTNVVRQNSSGMRYVDKVRNFGFHHFQFQICMDYAVNININCLYLL